MKNLEYYLALPYTVILRPDEDGSIVARVEELQGCVTDGATVPEALEKLDELKRAWIEDALEAGHPVPEPVGEEVLPSGKWVQRVTRTLHRKLTLAAKREGVSLNSLVSSILAEAVGERNQRNCIVQTVSHDSTQGWHQSFTDWFASPGEYVASAHVIATEVKEFKLGLAERLELISSGLPKDHTVTTLKAFYDKEKDQRLGKVC